MNTKCPVAPRLVSKSGAILRVLTPPRIATLFFVRSGIESQRQIAERLDRAPPTISNYIETLENLPIPLVNKDGHNHITTSEGNQIASAILRFMNNHLDADLQDVSLGQYATDHLSRLDEWLSPLHRFRSDPPFFILYMIGIKSSSGWMTDLNSNRVSIEDVISRVKDWLEDSMTRKQIQSQLRQFEEASTVECDEQEVTLTRKGMGQCRLLDQIIQLFVESTPDVFQKSIDGDPVLSLPTSLTVGEFVELATNVDREYTDETNLRLKVNTFHSAEQSDASR